MESFIPAFPRQLLSPTQKQTVLAEMVRRVEGNQARILHMLKTDVINERGADYPGRLGEMLIRLSAPLACYVGMPQQRESHLNNMNDFFRDHADAIIELWRAACSTESGWTSKKIREWAHSLEIPIAEIAVVRFTVSQGKILWEFRQRDHRVGNHIIGWEGEYVEMAFEDFKVFKDAGKRNPPQKEQNYQTRYAQFSGQPVVSRRNRNPRRNAKNLNHSNTQTCHICTYDVDTNAEIYKHKPDDGAPKVRRARPCCGEHYDYQLDHIPANSLLTRLEERTAGGFSREAGLVIAVPTHLHAFVSASYKHRAKTRDDLEVEFPSAAVYKDINSYLMFFWEERTQSFDLKKIGAFRYMYRQNVKAYEDFGSVQLDHLFMRSLKRFLKRRDGAQKINVLPSSSGWGHQTFFQHSQRRPYFVKLDDRVKNDITLAIMLRDVEKLETFYGEPSQDRFIIKTLVREKWIGTWDNLQALMQMGSRSAPYPFLFDLLKRALEEDDVSCHQMLLSIQEQRDEYLEDVFPHDVNGLSVFDIIALYYSSTDHNEFLEQLFFEESWEICWTHRDNAKTTPAMKAIKNHNDEFLKFSLKRSVMGWHALDAETSDISPYVVLNCFYKNAQNNCTFVDTQDANGDTALHHAVRERAEECVKIILAANPSLTISNNQGQTVVELAQNSTAEIRKLIEMAVRIQDVIDSKGAEEDEDLFEMLVVDDEGNLARDVCKLEGALEAIGRKALGNVLEKQFLSFMTNETTDELFTLLGLINSRGIELSMLHDVVRRNLPAKIALCAAVLHFEPEHFSIERDFDDVEQVMDEFHDDAVHVPTHNAVTVARIVFYRREYGGALQEFLSRKNEHEQTALALACELGHCEVANVLLACGAKLEKCLFTETHPALRRVAKLIHIFEGNAETIELSLWDLIEGESSDFVVAFFADLRQFCHEWDCSYINPCEAVFDEKNFPDSNSEINLDEDDTDEEKMDVPISLQHFITKPALSAEQRNSLVESVCAIEPLKDLLIQLIHASARRRELCEELLCLLQPQPAPQFRPH